MYDEKRPVMDDEPFGSLGAEAENSSINDEQGTEPSSHLGKGGLTILTTAIFITGEMAGSGVLALPKAVVSCGWIGLVVIIACGILAAFSGMRLGSCWMILRDRYPECRGQVRDPYPLIGYHAAGRIARVLVSVSNDLQLIGGATVFLLLSADNISSLLRNLGSVDISFCIWIVVVAAFLAPITWLGTPKDFWPVAIGAMISTATACVIIIVAALGADVPTPTFDNPTPNSFFLAFGTILFAFGGASTFPTLQVDMKAPQKFGYSVVYASIAIFAMYLPVAAVGFFVYGSNVRDNILASLPSSSPLTYSVEILITLHLLTAFNIILNPVMQEFEEIIHVPKTFGWKRCVMRTTVVAFILFVAESLPHFGALLSFIGGSTVTMLTFICPGWFYFKLCNQQKYGWPKIEIPLHEKILLIVTMVIGAAGGIAATISAISELASPASFVAPCYINSNITFG